ncbi:MAG: chromosome segregation protein SMC [Bacteroidota bacterium]
MRLTKLEIKGFKSFADKMVIHFDDGITGIVGPNGCGKSNVVDSIRWVLGEQKSRVLRSDKMENVIFNGTKNRKQTQLAEVSLTFDNTKNLIPTEYSQVTITRRYYRSGESEYLLNGVTCRLKDITNLFLDTGIASNSYAIIELKMVDDLLNDKDNSRRALFEEAAGISKFKLRKKETLRKLGDTDADLERVEDLLFEIEKNLKSLERQANQAKRYYELKDEYKHSSIALAKRSIDNQQLDFDAIEKQIQQENDKKVALVAFANEKEAAIEQAKSELITRERMLASRQKSLNDHVSSIRQYESDKKIKNERQNFLQDKIQTLQQQIVADKESSDRASIALESLKNEARQTETDVTGALDALESLRSDLDRAKANTNEKQISLNDLNEAFSQKRDEQFQRKKDLEIKEIQLASLQQELTKSSEDSHEQSASLEGFEQKLKDISIKQLQDESQVGILEKAESELAIRLEQTGERLQENQASQALTNRSLDAKQNEYNLTKSLVDNLEGFPEAIKFLKKSSDWKDAPLLSDVLSCDEKYRVAIENYLEYYMNFFVVQSQEQAIEAVRLLTESARGKANFFILERFGDHKISATSSNIGVPAMEVVEYDPKYGALIQYLLGDVFFSEGLTDKRKSESSVLLDTAGRIAFKKYGLSGGSVGLFEGKRIGRAKNLEKLDSDIKALTKEQKKLDTQNHVLQEELESLKKSSQSIKLAEARKELAKSNEIQITLQTKKEQFATLLSTNMNRRERIREQISGLSNEVGTLKPQIDEAQKELDELDKLLSEQRVDLEKIKGEQDLKASVFNEQNVTFHQKKNRLDSIQQEIKFKEESFQNTLTRIGKNKEDLDTTSESLAQLVKNSSQNDQDLVAMYEEKSALEAGVNEAEKTYYEGRTLIDNEEKSLRETQRQKETIDQLLLEWQNKRSEAKIGLTSIKDRLSVEFGIDPNELKEEDTTAYDKFTPDELKSKVEKLKSRIDNMGPINPMAMEAYEEIKERHTFINEQKTDLLEAKTSLLTTIDEIDEVAKTTFMEAFHKIKANFIEVFRTLFTDEDDCDLTLTDPDHPLESAIEIIAKPKGKKPLTINQLSGGEKTLTATSLLFSIYLIKPAPFCIFDEVDAPLDDANIDKFNEIIRKFSSESQFIIVTHNKRTMASTDVIYGVTMQEQGVSKVVPVDLRALA